MPSDERLTCFRKDKERIVGRSKGSESTYVQGHQSSGEDLFLRDRDTNSTDRPLFRNPGTDGNHAPIGQEHNDGSSANSQEIQVSIYNVLSELTEDQSVEALGIIIYVKCSKIIRKYP